ncbi:hypothetical protein [Amycolatopsis orientalis]|uniref:WXG100-like domain-containing protein n=1 Tax=Amycolatopsis orientalis TaxID=31958 RepID=UPI001F17CC6D|nr:hypothetical protein [Amycolatopsis orientalis]
MPIRVDRSDFGDVPEWARTLLEILGVSWPAANQHKFRRAAQEYDTVTDLLKELPDDIARVKRAIDEKLSMPEAGEAFDKSMAPLTHGTPNVLEELADGTKGIADGCRKIALDVEYTKFSAIGQLFLLAYEIAMEYALSAVTAGASVANITWHYALTRGYLLTLFKMLVRAIVFEVFIGVTGGLLIDVAVQRLQHERNEWDSDATSQTAISGAVGGLLGGVVGELGEKLGRKIGGLLGKDFGKIATDDLLKLVKDLKLPGGDELAEDWVRDMGRTLTDRAGRQLSDPATAFTKRAVEGFSDEVADRFAAAFGKTLGDDAARKLGRDYARTFVDNWGKHGLDGSGAFNDSLRDVLAPHSDKLGKDAVGLLTDQVPDVLTRNVGDRLGGNFAARALEFSTTFLFEGVSGVMGQAAMAAINGESVSAMEYGMGFVGGVVGGAVSHKLEGIGERALDSAVTSVKESFGGVTSDPAGGVKSGTESATTTGTGSVAPTTTSATTTASPSDAKTTTETKAATDVKQPSDAKTPPATKSTSDTKTATDGKPAPKSTSDTKVAKDSAPTAVRTSSEAGTAGEQEDEERPRTRPAPLRTTSEDVVTVPETTSSVQTETAANATVATESAPAVDLDLGEPFVEDLFSELELDGPATTEPVETENNETAETTESTETTTTETAGKAERDLTLADLPPFLAAGQALGSAPVLAVDGIDDLRAELTRLLPGTGRDQVDAIGDAVHADFESALSGLHFPVRTANGRREVRIRATLGGEVVSEPREKTKADLTVQGGTANSENLAVLEAGDLGTAVTVQTTGAGPYLTVGGKAALAAPGSSQTVAVSTSDQRAIRSGEGSRRVGLSVEFTVSVHDENGAETGEEVPRPVPGKVTVRLPDDLVGLTPPEGLVAKDLAADVGRGLQNPVPEAVTDLGEVFTGTAALLPRSVTAFGAPGRDALRAFLGNAGIRENFGAMLEGWVSSTALLSADGGEVAAVRMKAVLTKAELVGPTTETQLRLHESATTSSTVSAFTKRGFDASLALGGGGGVKGARVAAGMGVAYSARTVDTAVSGRTSTAKSGVQLKGDIGLYRFETTIQVQALDGGSTFTTATVYARVGMAEASAQGLPVPDGTGDGITPPVEKKFPPAHLAAGLAAGNVRVGEFDGAEAVLTEIRGRLQAIGRYAGLLPGWGGKADGGAGKRAGAARTLEMLANEHRLQAALSPAALRNRLDALLATGVSVTLKRQGTFQQDHVTVTVRLESKRVEHLGRAAGRVVRNATATGPALGASSATTKGWTAGPEGKVTFGATVTASAKYGRGRGTRTGAGPVVDSTDLTIGSADSEGFAHQGRFVVSITGFSRAHAMVRQTLPGLPGTQVPTVSRIWSTPEEQDEGPFSLPANFTVWMSDSLTLPADPGKFAPGAPRVRHLDPPRSITGHIEALAPPAVGDWLGVESIAHTGHVGSAALDALVEASDGDRALALPGGDAWTSVQAMLSTDAIKAALRSFTHGVVSADLVHSRRLADRVGRIGVVARLSNPTFVRAADDAGAERSASGGFRFDGGENKSKGPTVTVGVAGSGSVNGDPTGSATGGLAVKPWAKTTTEADGLDISATVDRNVTTAAGTPRVLARFDIAFTVLAEARQQTALLRPDARGAARFVDLPGAALVWLTEDQARGYGLLPAGPAGHRERDEKLAAPVTLPRGKSGSLGLGAVERLPDLSDLVPKLTAELVKAKVPLLPGVSLNDAMNNWARLTDLVSPDGVRGLLDSALDGGIPLHTHLPKLFTDSGYQILLTAKTLREPAFREVVNDGRTVEHSTVRAVRKIRAEGTATSWSAALRAGGQEKYQGGETTTSVGGAVTKGIGAIKTTGTTEVLTEQITQLRTGTGPAALFDVPVEFTLEVHREGRPVVSATTGERTLGIRLLADNLTPEAGTGKESGPAEEAGPLPLSPEDATPAALTRWRQGTVTELPEMASVEAVRAAERLRTVVRSTLTEAGADSGITGYGTSTVNALWSSLSPQLLQAFLPAMTRGSLPVPALREAAVLRGKRADVEVHARLGRPKLVALSDGVNLENPTNVTAARSAERKVVEVGEMGVTGPTVTPVDEPGNIGGLVTGADARWTSEPADATVDGTTVSAVANLKPVGRTALVRFDVDYRVVVKVDGRTRVVDVPLPASADVRMPIGKLADITGQKVPRVLKARQSRVARTAKAWRDAETGALGQRRRAEQLVERLGVGVDWRATVDAARVWHPEPLAQRHHKYARETEKALRDAETVADAAQLRFDRVTAHADAAETRLALLEAAESDLDDLAQGADGAARTFQEVSSALAAAHRRVELAEANQDLAAALDDVSRLTGERADAKLRRDLFREVLRERRDALTDARAEAAETREQRVAATDQLIRTQAALQAAWLDFVDGKQDAWWLAKGALDAEFARLTAPPGSPGDEKWRHSRATDARWFSVADPLDPARWEPLRATTPRRAVATETADVLTTLLSGKDKRYDGVIRYGVSRFEVDGRGVTEFTVPINLVPGRGVSDEQVARLRDRAAAGVEKLLNRRHGLPNGDQLHVRIEFTGDRLTDAAGNPRYRAYDVVAGDDERTTQTNWRSEATPEELAHEVLHYLGAGDEEHDEDRVLLSREDDGTTGVVTGDGSIMGKGVAEPGVTPKLLPRHAWMIQHVLESQLGPGYRLTDPGQDPLPGTPSVNPAASAGLTDAQWTALSRERSEVVQVGGDTVGANLVEAITRTLALDSQARQGELRERAAALRHATPEEVAVALGVRVRLLTEDGTTVTLGPEHGETVLVVLSPSADFLATAPVPVRPGLTAAQQDTLTRLGKAEVAVGGEPVTGNLIAAIAAAVEPDSPSRQARLRELGATLRTATAAKIAEAFGVRLHVVTENGEDVAHGPAGRRPVRIVRTRDGGYLATRDLDPRTASRPTPNRPAAETTVAGAPETGAPVTSAMLGAEDRIVGTAFPSKPGDARTATGWARTTATRPVVEYHVLLPKKADEAASTQPTAAGSVSRPAPWASPVAAKQPIFLFLHSGPEMFRIKVAGRFMPKRVTGTEFAALALGDEGFRQALETRPEAPIVLLACESGKLNRPGGGGYDFRRELKNRGHDRTVYAPTETINLVQLLAAVNVDKEGEFVEIAGHPGEEGEPVTEQADTVVTFAKRSRVLDDDARASVVRFAAWAPAAADAMTARDPSLPSPWIQVTGYGNAVSGRPDTALARANAVAAALRPLLPPPSEGQAPLVVKPVAAPRDGFPPLVSADPAQRRRSVTLALVRADGDSRAELGLLPEETVTSWLSRTASRLGEDPGLWASSPLVAYLDRHLSPGTSDVKTIVLRLSVDPGSPAPRLAPLVGTRGHTWAEFVLPSGAKESIEFRPSTDGSPAVRLGDTGHTPTASYEVWISPEDAVRALDHALRHLRTPYQTLSFNSLHFAAGLFERATGTPAPSAGWLATGPGDLGKRLREAIGGSEEAGDIAPLDPSAEVRFRGDSDTVDPGSLQGFVRSLAEELLTRPPARRRIEIVVKRGQDAALADRRGANLEAGLRTALATATGSHGLVLEPLPIRLTYQQDDLKAESATIGYVRTEPADAGVPIGQSVQNWLNERVSLTQDPETQVRQRTVAQYLLRSGLPDALDRTRLLNADRPVFRFQVKTRHRDVAAQYTGHAWIEIHDPFGGETLIDFAPQDPPSPPWATVPGTVTVAPARDKPTTYSAEYLASANDVIRGLDRVLALSGRQYRLTSHNCTTFVQDVYSAVFGAPAPQAGRWVQGPTDLERTLRTGASHITVRPVDPAFPTGLVPDAPPRREDPVPAADLVARYREATADLPHFRLSDNDFDIALAEFSRLAGTGELRREPDLTLPVEQLDTALGELEERAEATETAEERSRLRLLSRQVRALANDALLVSALAPARDTVLAPLTPQRLRSMLSEVATILHSGQDPFAAEGSPWRGLDYDRNAPLPRRLVELTLMDTPPVVAGTVREDPLFRELTRHPEALGDALFTASGGFERAFAAAAADEAGIPPAATLARVRDEIARRLAPAEEPPALAGPAVALLLAAPVPADPEVRLAVGGTPLSVTRPAGRPWTRDDATREWWRAADPAVAVDHRVANPVTRQDLGAAHRDTPAVTVRSEDGGLTRSGRPWQATIGYDLRRFTVDRDGHDPVRVRLHTVRLRLDDPGRSEVDIVDTVDSSEFRSRVEAAVNDHYNQGYRLPGGEQLLVEVEFTDREDAHGTVFVTGPGTPADQRHWPSDGTGVQFAHELGHFLGLYDEYFVDAEGAPVFQHADGAGRVATGPGLMTAAAITGDVVLEPRNLLLLSDRAHALAGDDPQPVRQPPRGTEREPGYVATEADVREFLAQQEMTGYLEQVARVLQDHPHLASTGKAELAALRAYSHTRSTAIDNYLAGKESPAYAAPLTRLLASAVTRFPARHSGPVTRVMGLPVPAAKELFVKGERYTDSGFFRGMQGGDQLYKGKKVIVSAEVHDGAFIASASNRPSEREVLLPPGTEFEVLSVEEAGDALRVSLRQIGATPTRIGTPFTGSPGDGPPPSFLEDKVTLSKVIREAAELAPDLASRDTRAHHELVVRARRRALREATTRSRITVNTWRSAAELDEFRKGGFVTEPAVLVAGGGKGNVAFVIDDALAVTEGDLRILPPGSTFEVVEVARAAQWHEPTVIHLRQADPPEAADRPGPGLRVRTVAEQAEKVVDVLARGLRERDGDLHLTAVEALVDRHPDAPLVWHAAVKAVVDDPVLASKVRTITYQRREGGDVRSVTLPDSVWKLLTVPGGSLEQSAGEITEPVEIAPPPSPGSVLAEAWRRDATSWAGLLDQNAAGTAGPAPELLNTEGFPATRSDAWADLLGARRHLSRAEAAHAELTARLAPGGAGSSRDAERHADSETALEAARDRVARATADVLAWGNDPVELDPLFEKWRETSAKERPRLPGGAGFPLSGPENHGLGDTDGGGQAGTIELDEEDVRPPEANDFADRYDVAFDGLPNLATEDLGARLDQLSRLAEGGRLENHTGTVFGSPAISAALSRIDRNLGELADPDVRASVRSLVNDAVLVTSLVPTRERDVPDNSRFRLKTVRDRRVLQPLSIDRLQQVLGDLAVNVEAGRDPFTAEHSTVRGIGYRPEEELPTRLARLGLTNLSHAGRATLREDPLFQALLGNPAALTESLFAATGHDEQHFMNTCGAAATNTDLRAVVPTIAGLLLAGRGVVARVEDQLAKTPRARLDRRDRPLGRSIGDLAAKRVAEARERFAKIEKRATRLAAAGSTGPGHRADWADLTTRWSRTMQKLAAVIWLNRGDGSAVPVLTRKVVSGAWELSVPLLLPVALDRPGRRTTGTDDVRFRDAAYQPVGPTPRESYRGQHWSEPDRPLSPYLATSAGEFWDRVRSGTGIRIFTTGHEMVLKAAEHGGERMFVVSDPKKAQFDYLTIEQFVRFVERDGIMAGKHVLEDRAVVVPSARAPAHEVVETEPGPDEIVAEPVAAQADAVLDGATRFGDDAGIWLDDPANDPDARERQRRAVEGLREDRRFYTVVAHTGPSGMPEFQGRPITPEVMVELLARLSREGAWPDGKPLRFVACGLGSPDVEGYVSTVLHSLADQDIVASAYAGDTAVWSTPGGEDEPGRNELVVAGRIGFQEDGRPAVTDDGRWLSFRFAAGGRTEIEVTEHGSYLVPGDDDPPLFRQAPGGFDVVPTAEGQLVERSIPGSMPFGTKQDNGIGLPETVQANLDEFAGLVAAQPTPPPVEVRGARGDARLAAIAAELRSSFSRHGVSDDVRLRVIATGAESDVLVSTVIPDPAGEPVEPAVEATVKATVTDSVFDALVPVTDPADVATVPLDGNRGIRLDDPRLAGVAGGYPADDRFFTFLAHGDANGAPVRASGAGSLPLSPSEVATMLVRAKDEGHWDGVKPLMFASCGAGTGGGRSFAARVLDELRAHGVDVDAVAPDGPVYFVPGAAGPGHLVVTGRAGVDAAGRPVVAPDGNWVQLTGSPPDAHRIGAHIGPEDSENRTTEELPPGYAAGEPVSDLDGAVRLAADDPPAGVERGTAEVAFPAGSKVVPASELPKLDSVATRIAETAIRRSGRDLPMPLVAVTVTGYGNGSPFGIKQAVRTGQARADATEVALRGAIDGQLDRLRGDDPPLEEDGIAITSRSGGSDVGPLSAGQTLETARRRAVITFDVSSMDEEPEAAPKSTSDTSGGPVATTLLRPPLVNRNSSQLSSKSSISINSVVVSYPYPGKVLNRGAVYSAQRDVLRVHGLEPVLVEGDTPHDAFREALVASLSDQPLREHTRIIGLLGDFARLHPDSTDLGAIARFAGVLVHVINQDGTWTSHGDKTGKPVHLLRADADGADTYLGTRENVHIGRPKVGYPGSTVLVIGKQERKVLHRGEFEIETIKGQHYVRLYTAILTPAGRDSENKDVHQDENGVVTPFSGRRKGETGPKVFWVGGGRPLRAVQWTSKYETDSNRKDHMQPMLRTFLVPLDEFSKVTKQAVVEASSKDNELSMNVDQNGDTNQFGLRGTQFEKLQQKVLDGSLVTYTVGGKVTVMPEVAGRQEDIADLYVRLGLRPDFDSAALGRENDPWFTWDAEGQKSFRNDAKVLRGMARTLSNHYHTWNKSPEAFFSPPADVIPDSGKEAAKGAKPNTLESRTAEMNAFLNTHGPGKDLVDQFRERLWAKLDPVIREEVGDGVPITAEDLRSTVTSQLNRSLNIPQPVLAEALKKPAAQVTEGQEAEGQEAVPRTDTPEQIKAAIKADPEIPARAADAVADAVLAALAAGYGQDARHGEFGRGVGGVVFRVVQRRFQELAGPWAAEIEQKAQAKEEARRKKDEEKNGPRKVQKEEGREKRPKAFLTGFRAEEFTQVIAEDLVKDPVFKELLRKTTVMIGPDAFAAQFKARILAKATEPVLKSELYGIGKEQLGAHFDTKLAAVADALAKELNHKNSARFGSPEFRRTLAEKAKSLLQTPKLLDKVQFTAVSRDDADKFMRQLPDYATQAEIGSAIATDERRIKLDFDTRQSELADGAIEGTPYENEYASWRDEHILGYTQKHDPSVFDEHRRIGGELAKTITEQLDNPGPLSGKVILDELLSKLDKGVTDEHAKLGRKFAETVKPQPGRPDRAEGQTKPNTFGEHAQMVLNRYLTLTSGQEDADRFVTREAVVKAILFHDMDKVNSKNQYGDAQVSHDREPEHRGAIQYMNRHEGLWACRRDFELVRAFVDSDPFGYYFRDMGGMTAQGVYDFVRGLAVRVGRPGGGTPTAADVRNLFREFHQYYQADFSSYSAQAKFVNDTTKEVQEGYDKLTGVAVVKGEHLLVGNEHRFLYSTEKRGGGKPTYEEKYQALVEVFDQAPADVPVDPDVQAGIFEILVPSIVVP